MLSAVALPHGLYLVRVDYWSALMYYSSESCQRDVPKSLRSGFIKTRTGAAS
jgi:hypothetical protein